MLFELYLHVGMYGRMFGCIDVEDDVATTTNQAIAVRSTDDVKEVDKSDSNLFTDTVGLEGFLTCCNFLSHRFMHHFIFEMNTKIKIITGFYGQPKKKSSL